jgi:holo-[acyl-carrier protein] synthase
MVIGIGLDLVELARVEGLLARHGDRFLRRILTPAELESLRGDRVAYVASRLACKEAAFKALGTGWGMGVTWKQVEILRIASGAPQIHFHGTARRRLAARGPVAAHVTLTHTRGHAAAVVVIEERAVPRGEVVHA